MLFGIDCASVDANKKRDWATAKAKGPISFAIVRSNWGTQVDPNFSSDWEAIKAAGLVRGAYLFLRFPIAGKPKPPPPEDQAQALIDTVGDLEPTDLPPTIDLEFPGNGRTDTGMSAAQALDWLRIAWKLVEQHYEVAPIIYTSGRVWSEDLGDIAAPDLVDSPLWLARYFWKANTPAARNASAFDGGKLDPPVPRPWGDPSDWWIHQYQGDAVALPGFSSTIDMNRFNGMVKGDRGARVKWVQRRLSIAESGTFDAAMVAEVVAFQTDHELVADGIIGPQTFAALCWA